VEGTVPHPQLAPRLQAGFVGFAADADREDDRVIALAMKVEDAMMLPFVMVTDAEGEYLGGYGGVGTPPALKRLLHDLGVPEA